MTLQALQTTRFARKTQLGPNEYRKNFHQIDREAIDIVTSEEADQVTSMMSKIYLCLVNAPQRFWEREGVLRIVAEERGGKLLKAWDVLCKLVGVSSATASKALQWMHEQGIIGYFSGKNGVGLRIFLNRAVSSIGVRQAQAVKKILAFPPASHGERPASKDEAAFNDSFAVLETSDTDKNPRAPKNGADTARVYKTPSDSPPSASLENVVTRLRAELEPTIREAARQAAACEHERTREWLEKRGLPKAARVAQHEAYNVLRKYGVISEVSRLPRSRPEVERNGYTPPEPQRLAAEEVNEFAQACIAMLEAHGQSIEVTLSKMNCEAGGFLLPEDAVSVRERANFLLSAGDGRGGK